MRTVYVLLASGLFAAACTASAEEVRPPADTLYFPTGAAVAPDDSVLFVANANSELRFDSGSISVVPLAEVDRVIAEWLTSRSIPQNCSQDLDHTETLTCDATVFLTATADAGARVGNFATDIAVQDRGGGTLRLFVPTRGDPSVAWVDWNGSGLTCNSNGEGYQLCDDAHRLSFVGNDTDQPLPEEPFGVFADSAGQFAMVTHLTTGAISLIDSPVNGDAVVTDVVATVFLPDPTNGLRGATGVVGRTPRAEGDIVYVGSRSEDRIQTFTVGRPVNGASPFLLAGNYFFLDSVGNNTGLSSDTRGMTFSGDGNRFFLINRRPPSLQVFDTSIGPTGFPKNEPIGAADICRQSSTVTLGGTGDDERVYVSCFQDGQVYVIDPRGLPMQEDIITVGRGPYAVVAANSRKKLFVTNFLEDTIAVVDIAPGSPTRNRVVLRIGIPRPL